MDYITIDYTIAKARYSKDRMAIHTPSSDGYKTRAARLAERLANGRYSHREHAYILSKTAATRFEKLFQEGWDASRILGTLEPPKVKEIPATFGG